MEMTRGAAYGRALASATPRRADIASSARGLHIAQPKALPVAEVAATFLAHADAKEREHLAGGRHHARQFEAVQEDCGRNVRRYSCRPSTLYPLELILGGLTARGACVVGAVARADAGGNACPVTVRYNVFTRTCRVAERDDPEPTAVTAPSSTA